jgi:hypothetical protein
MADDDDGLGCCCGLVGVDVAVVGSVRKLPKTRSVTWSSRGVARAVAVCSSRMCDTTSTARLSSDSMLETPEMERRWW